MEWQPTMELRWHLHEQYQQWNGQTYVPVGPRVLEQKWTNHETGAAEWREIYTHYESVGPPVRFS